MFVNDYPDLAVKVKYNFYYKYFKENFDYTFGRPQVDVCSQCESLNTKIRDPDLSVTVLNGVQLVSLYYTKGEPKNFIPS